MPSGRYNSQSYDYEYLVKCAVKEVTRQLDEQGGCGSVWVDEWKEWYQRDLGTLREFLESKPAMFRVVPEGDRKYHVELASYRRKGGKGYPYQGCYGKGGGPSGFRSGPQSMGFGWGQGGGFWSKTTADAIKEIKAQLYDQGGTGKVWVDNWPRRFQPELGTLREFLEARWDKFEVHSGRGNSYTVSLKRYGNEEGTGGSNGSKGSKGDRHGGKPPMRQRNAEMLSGPSHKEGQRWRLKETDAKVTEAAEHNEDKRELDDQEDGEEGERPSAFDDRADDLDD